MSCILPQLNILCRSLVKPYYTKMTIQPLFIIHIRPFHAFSNVLDFIKAVFHIYQNVRYCMWSKNGIFNVTAVLSTSILCFMFPVHGVHGSKKILPANIVQTLIIRSNPYSHSLYLLSKLSCQDVRDVDDVKRVLLLQTGRISQMQCVRLTAEKGGDCEGIHS